MDSVSEFRYEEKPLFAGSELQDQTRPRKVSRLIVFTNIKPLHG